MNPCYGLVDIGRDHAHYGLLYPFAERPDVSVRVLWYRVDFNLASQLPETPFLLRNWDRLDQLEQTKPGTDQEYKEYYYGPLPINFPGRPCGTPAQWMGQIDYETWLGGGYACACPANLMPAYVSSVTCNDASLNVSPNVGDVIVNLNINHQNTWMVQQLFRAPVISIVNGFALDNSLEPPSLNLIRSGWGQDETLGMSLGIITTPLPGTAYHSAYMRLTPDLTGGPTPIEFFSEQTVGWQDTFFRLVDAAGSLHDGVSGSVSGLFTTYGGIVTGFATLPGDASQFLNGTGVFSTPTGGFADPMTSTGDLITSSDNTPTPARVPPNTDQRTQLLTSYGTGTDGNPPLWLYGVWLAWQSPITLTVSNTTSPTSILDAASAATLTANTASPGTTARIAIDGAYGTTSGSGVWRLNVFLGSTQIGTIGSIPTVGVAFGAYFRIRLLVTLTATGTSGHAIVLGSVAYDHNTGAASEWFVTSPATGATVDTTTDLLPDVQIVMAAASPSDKVTVLNRAIEWLG